MPPAIKPAGSPPLDQIILAASNERSERISTRSLSSLRCHSSTETYEDDPYAYSDAVPEINDQVTHTRPARRKPRQEPEATSTSINEQQFLQRDAFLSDVSTSDDDTDALRVANLKGKPIKKESKRSSRRSSRRKEPPPIRKTTPERRNPGKDNNKKPTQHRDAKSPQPRNETSRDGLHYYRAGGLRGRKDVGPTTKDTFSAFPVHTFQRSQSERGWRSGGDPGMKTPKNLKGPSPNSIDMYLASSEWTGCQRIKDDWCEFLQNTRERSTRTKRSTNDSPHPSLVTHLSELNLGTSKTLESTIRLYSRRLSTGMLPPLSTLESTIQFSSRRMETGLLPPSPPQQTAGSLGGEVDFDNLSK